jgi:hypothetical protein
MHVDPERVSPKTPHGVASCHSQPNEPPTPRVTEREKSTGVIRRYPKKPNIVRVTTNNTIKGNNINGRDSGPVTGKIGMEETHTVGVTHPLRLIFSDSQVSSGSVKMGRLGEALLKQEVMNCADPAANIKKGRLRGKGMILDRCDQLPSRRIGTATPEPTQIPLRNSIVKLSRGGTPVTAVHEKILLSVHATWCQLPITSGPPPCGHGAGS